MNRKIPEAQYQMLPGILRTSLRPGRVSAEAACILNATNLSPANDRSGPMASPALWILWVGLCGCS